MFKDIPEFGPRPSIPVGPIFSHDIENFLKIGRFTFISDFIFQRNPYGYLTRPETKLIRSRTDDDKLHLFHLKII